MRQVSRALNGFYTYPAVLGIQQGTNDSTALSGEAASGDAFYWGRSYTGTKATGAGPANLAWGPVGYMFDLRYDDADAGPDFVRSLYGRTVFGGSSAKGGRIGIIGEVVHQLGITNAANANRNYVGVLGNSHAYNGDGGTDLTAAGAKGAYFGGNFITFLHSGSTNVFDGTSVEIDICADTGSSARYLRALSLCNGSKIRGGTLDAALTFSSVTDAFGTGIGWNYLLCATDANSGDPTYSGSWLFGSVWITNPTTKRTITGGFDLSGFNVGTGALFQGAQMALTESGISFGANLSGASSVTAGNGATNATLALVSKGTGAVVLESGGGVNRLQADDSVGIRLMPKSSATPVNNGELSVEATSNTSLTFRLKGSDGTVRSNSLTLV